MNENPNVWVAKKIGNDWSAVRANTEGPYYGPEVSGCFETQESAESHADGLNGNLLCLTEITA